MVVVNIELEWEFPKKKKKRQLPPSSFYLWLPTFNAKFVDNSPSTASLIGLDVGGYDFGFKSMIITTTFTTIKVNFASNHVCGILKNKPEYQQKIPQFSSAVIKLELYYNFKLLHISNFIR